MSRGRGGTSVNLGVKSRQRSTIILESSPSAEIASYDYEIEESRTTFEESHKDENRVEEEPDKDCPPEEDETTSARDLAKECIIKTVCFSADNHVSAKLTSATELATENSSQKNITPQECAVCKNIVNESGDEGGNFDISIADSKELLKSPDASVQGDVKKQGEISRARGEKRNYNSPKIKTSLKDLTKKKVVNSSLLDGYRNSKIPRANMITCAVARVYQTARIPLKCNSKTPLCNRSFNTTEGRSKNLIRESYQATVKKTCEIMEQPKEPRRTESIDIEQKESKNARIGLRTKELADTKPCRQPCDELPKTLVSNTGNNPSPSSPRSVLKNLRLSNACRSCNDRRETVNLELSIHDVQDPWSDSKSSPEIRSPGRWPKTLNMNPYIDSTSEEVDLFSEYSTDDTRPTKKKCFTGKASFKSPISKCGSATNSARPRPRRRVRFSFFNTLFDIIFWPFLFLRTNR